MRRREETFADGGEGNSAPDGWNEEQYIYDGDDVVHKTKISAGAQ